MVQQNLSQNCCGCGMCTYICPKGAIHMVPDDEGFLRPIIDSEICINCGRCIKHCAYKTFKPMEKAGIFFAAKNKNPSIIQKSSSGGVFYPLAVNVIQNKGSVYGAAYNWEKNTIEHIRIDQIAHIPKCMGSKYVQSAYIDYVSVRNDLEAGKKVLFSGCPCQIDACLHYLDSKRVNVDNLLVVDFVCHGVPSPKIWKDFISVLERKYHAKVTDFSFRYKSESCRWGSINTCATFGDKSAINTKLVKSYIKLYFESLMTRDDCTHCPYTSLSRTSDITLADCWGIENVYPDFNSSNGVSLVIINTEKGEKYIENISGQLELCRIDYTKLNQPHLYAPSDHNPQRNKFWVLYRSSGYYRAACKYGMYTISKRISLYYMAIIHAVHKRIMHKD